MKKYILLIFLVMLCSGNTFAQISAEDVAVYKSLLSSYTDVPKSNTIRFTVKVYYRTIDDVLKGFNFKKTDANRWLGKDSIQNWKPFFYKINLKNVHEGIFKDNNIGYQLTKQQREKPG